MKKTVSFDTSPVLSPELRLMRAELGSKRDALKDIVIRACKEEGSMNQSDSDVVKNIKQENR